MMLKEEFNGAAKRKQPSPFSLRLSWEERAELDRITQGQPWGAYIKELLFVVKKRVVRRYKEVDRKLLARILGALGKSRVASNLNQLAKAANTGSLPVNDEVVKAILEACRAVQWMKMTLIQALGIKAHKSGERPMFGHDSKR